MTTFYPSIFSPYFPSTYNIVFTVSTGVSIILNREAIVDAVKVFMEMLIFLVDSYELRYSRTNLFEKVSPNHDKGPCNKATV